MTARRVLACLLVWAGLGAAFPALAQTWNTQAGPTLIQATTTKVTALPTGPLATLLNQPRSGALVSGYLVPDDGGALLRDLLKGPGPKAEATVQMTRALPWAKLAKGVMHSLPLLGTALMVADLLEAIRCREGFGGGPECDLGQDETTSTQSQFCVTYNTQTCGPTKQAACSAQAPQAWTESGFSYAINAATFVEPYCQISVTATSHCSGACTSISYRTVQQTPPVEVTQCPAIPDPDNPGQTIIPSKGIDLKCPTGSYVPRTEDQATDRAVQWGPKTLGPAIAAELIDRGAPIEHAAPSWQVESPVQIERKTITNPDGSKIVEDTDFPWYSAPDGYGWNKRTRTETYPPGATIPPPGEIPGGTVVETGGNTGSGAAPEIITCGLPNTPPCKIDEGGTPPPPPPTAFDPASDPIDPLRALITDPQIPQIAFSWTFALPSSCSVMQLGSFGGQTMTFDLCRFQPMIHDLLGIFWAGLGILGAWGLLARTFGGAS